MTTTDQFLEHHGVKGMKWGVINEDPLNAEDHAILKAVGANEHTSDRMRAMYGPESSESTPAAKQRKGLTSRQKKLIGVAGAGAVIFGTAFVIGYLDKNGKLPSFDKSVPNGKKGEAYKKFMNSLNNTKVTNMNGLTPDAIKNFSTEDSVFSPGHIFKRVSTIRETDIRPGGFFAAANDADVNRYKAVLPAYWKEWGMKNTEGFVVNLKANTEVKAPSAAKTYSIFKSMLDDDVEVEFFGEKISTKVRSAYRLVSSSKTDDEVAAEIFPLFAASWNTADHPVSKAFFQKVKDAGYNALIDMNDAGSIGDKPLRLLDGSIFSIDSHDVLSKLDIAKARESILELAHAFVRVIRALSRRKKVSDAEF